MIAQLRYIACLVLILMPLVTMAQIRALSVCEGTEAIDAQLGAKMRKFQPYKGFLQATLVEDSGAIKSLEVLYKPEAVILKERIPVSDIELNALCAEIKALKQVALQAPPMAEELDHEGRKELLYTSVGYSLFYGAMIPVAIGNVNPSTATGSLLMTGSAGFFLPFLLSANNSVTAGMARGFSAGSALGIGHGVSLSTLLMGGNINPQVMAGSIVLGGISEGLGGLMYAKHNDLSKGHMNLMGTGGGWGYLHGSMLPIFANDYPARLFGISSLAVSGLGIVAADKFGKRHSVASGDPVVVNNLGILGTSLGISAVVVISDDIGRGALGAILLSSAVGLKVGLNKIKAYDYTSGQANIMLLGTLCGGLFGAGVVAVVDIDAEGEAYLVGSVLGATGGFLLSDYVIRKGAKGGGLGALKVNFNPLALAPGFSKLPTAQPKIQNPSAMQPQPVRVTWRF